MYFFNCSTAHCVTCRFEETCVESHAFLNSGEINDVSKTPQLLKQRVSAVPLWSNSSPQMVQLLLYRRPGTYDMSQHRSPYSFIISSTMSTLYEVVFNLNATCCVMSVHCWHFYSGSLNATPANRWRCSIFIHVSCLNLALLLLCHPTSPLTPPPTACYTSETKGYDLSKSLRLPVRLFLWLIRLCNTEITFRSPHLIEWLCFSTGGSFITSSDE